MRTENLPGIPLGPSGRGWVEHDIGVDSGLYHGKGVVRPTWNAYGDDFVGYLGELSFQAGGEVTRSVGAANVKYVVLQGYHRSVGNTPASAIEREFFSSQSGLTPVYEDGDVMVFENEHYVPLVYAASQTYVVVGGQGALNALSTLESYDPAGVNLIFAHQVVREGGVEELRQVLERADGVIFYNSEPTDLAMLLVDEGARVNAAAFGSPSGDVGDAWERLDDLNRLGMMVAGGRTLGTQGRAEVSIPISVDRGDHYQLWLRLAHGPDRGALRSLLDGQLLPRLLASTPGNVGIGWVLLDEVELEAGSHELLLQNVPLASEGVYRNDVDQILLTEAASVERALLETEQLLADAELEKVVLLEGEHALRFTKAGGSDAWTSISRPYVASWGTALIKDLAAEDAPLDLDYAWPGGGSYQAYARLFDPIELVKAAGADERGLQGAIPPAYVSDGSRGLLQAPAEAAADWSSADRLGVWFQGAGSGAKLRFRVFFGDGLGSHAEFRFEDALAGWQRLTFARVAPDAVVGVPNWANVAAVSLEAERRSLYGQPTPVLLPYEAVQDLRIIGAEAVATLSAATGSLVYLAGEDVGNWLHRPSRLDLWLEGQGTGRPLELRVLFDDAGSSFASYRLTDGASGWDRVSLADPDDMVGSEDWTKVRGLALIESRLPPLTGIRPAFAEDASGEWLNLNPDTADLVDQSGVLKLDLRTSPRAAFSLLERRLAEGLDWSGAVYLALPFQGRASGEPFQLTIYSGDTLENWVRFDFVDSGEALQEVQLELGSPTFSAGLIDWTQVRRIRLGSGNKDLEGTFTFGVFSLASGVDEPTPVRWVALTPALTEALPGAPESASARDAALESGLAPSDGAVLAIPAALDRGWLNLNPGTVGTAVTAADSPPEGDLALVLERPEPRSAFGLIDRPFETPQDWSDARGIGLWLKGAGSGEEIDLTIFFGGTHDNRASYRLADDAGGWNFVAASLDDPVATAGDLDWTKVWKIRLSSGDKERGRRSLAGRGPALRGGQPGA